MTQPKGSKSGSEFRRGLGARFMDQLETAARGGGWFADVLADKDLVLGVRDNYMNVYWRGCSLFRIGPGGNGKVKASTHVKYLLDADLSQQVPFDGSEFAIKQDLAPLLRKYESASTLSKLKRAAKRYSGGEKEGLQAVIRANDNVIDTEIAFGVESGKNGNSLVAQRIDLACLNEENGSVRLRFWEAKLYDNPELRAGGDTMPPVVGQIDGYRKWISKNRETILESYRTVAKNLFDIDQWNGHSRKAGTLIERVANETKALEIDDTPFVGLLVYGFDQSQKGRWATAKKKIEAAGVTIRAAGDPKGIKL